jgi:very-short-patch-repair endonuclease
MHKPSPHHATVIASHAARLRHSPTPSEARLWEALRSQQLGVAFRRQVTIGPFIADFLAPARKLIVEVDGGYHSRRSAPDARRERDLTRLGYRVLHVKAEDVHRKLPAVVSRIVEALGG